MKLIKYCIFFILAIVCFVFSGCDFADQNLIKFEEIDQYLWIDNIAFEQVSTIMPIKIGKAFGYGYAETISRKCKIYELEGQSRDEWFYIRYPSNLMIGNGDLYKAVTIVTPTIATFGITSIGLCEMGKGDVEPFSTISDKILINKIINILASDNAESPFEKNMTGNSIYVMFLSSDYPGLFYESVFRQDEGGRKYLSKIYELGYVCEIGDILDSYTK